MNRYLSELIGTFFLTLSVGLAMSYGDRFAAIAIGAVLISLTYLGMKASGAHYNPAISLAMLMLKKVSPKDFGFYLLAQLVGAFAAAGLVMLVAIDDSYVFAFAPGRGDFSVQAAIVEVILSFLFTLVYLVTTQSKVTRGNDYYGFAIGFVFMAIYFMGAPISGGAFNPAIGIAANVVTLQLEPLWIYGLAPFIGGALASYASRVYP